MNATAPLQLLLFRHGNDSEALSYENAIISAFQGGKTAAMHKSLDIQSGIFAAAPPCSVKNQLEGFCHTLAVVLIDQALLQQGGEDLWDWLADYWQTARQDGRCKLLPVAMDERVGEAFTKKRHGLDRVQLLQATTLGERAQRPEVLALRLLHECRVLLAKALFHTSCHLRLFISHAKCDGLPLAHALKHQIDILKLGKFYDAEDLPAGGDWEKDLENTVAESLIVILRTDAYDGRYWCQQEVLWADEHAAPAVLVDARTRLNYPGSALPFERIPSARIPDGNLLRILLAALQEGLRHLLFQRRIQLMKERGELPTGAEVVVYCQPPGMPALLRACERLNTANASPRYILYPDPPLHRGWYEAAQALVAAHAPGVRLATPQTLAATQGAAP